MYSSVWRTCIVFGVSVGLVRLWFDHPVATMLALPLGAAFLHLLHRVWHATLTSDEPSPPPAPRFQTAAEAAIIGLGVVGLLLVEVLLGLVALVVGFITAPRTVASALRTSYPYGP